MKKFRLGILVLAAFLLLPLQVGASDLTRAAAEYAEGIENYTVAASIDMTLAASGFSLEMSLTGDYAIFLEEERAMGISSISMMGESLQTEHYIFKEEDGTVYEVQRDLSSEEEGEWIAFQSGSFLESLSFYHAPIMLEIIADGTAEIVIAGDEEIDGVMTTKYMTTLSWNENSEAFQTMFGEVLPVDNITAFEMPVAVWLSKDEGIPLRYTADLSPILDAVAAEEMADATEEEAAAFDEQLLFVQVDISQVNATEDFALPEDALAAIAEMEE